MSSLGESCCAHSLMRSKCCCNKGPHSWFTAPKNDWNHVAPLIIVYQRWSLLLFCLCVWSPSGGCSIQWRRLHVGSLQQTRHAAERWGIPLIWRRRRRCRQTINAECPRRRYIWEGSSGWRGWWCPEWHRRSFCQDVWRHPTTSCPTFKRRRRRLGCVTRGAVSTESIPGESSK